MNSLMGEHRAQPPDAPALLHWYPTDAPPPGDVPEFILRYLLVLGLTPPAEGRSATGR
jgi:hypothetical protein